MLLAASTGAELAGIVLFVLVYLLPFFVARRIGQRKGRRWFWYALFLGWIGVLILALLSPTASASIGLGSTYHVPPGARRRY